MLVLKIEMGQQMQDENGLRMLACTVQKKEAVTWLVRATLVFRPES